MRVIVFCGLIFSLISSCLATLMWLPATVEAVDLGSIGMGVGGSWMSQDYDFGNDPQLEVVDGGVVEPAAGAFLWIRLHHRISAGVEVLYLRKGFESTPVVINSSGQVVGETAIQYNVNYLSIPLTARFEIETLPGLLYLFVGPSAEILLSHDEFGQVFENFNTVTAAFHVGVGFERERFGGNIRYSRDFSSSLDAPAAWSLQSVKNHGVLALFTIALWR